ncbi:MULTISPECIES: galactan export ABC transporter ATP-binding subunit Wzt/RfbE [Prauserella salsuginis group]|uniref:ABC-2 type transport system ATP-binding protein n=2 Tax=Prauserella salsuginis group TaxID=2893672 RepID=A0A839XLS9_9PSEU|nr:MULTISPECIES: ABC transporter ATP-binding protein [Prauserella salsuginis group]MBB3662494.1 ABC-2 type transport system ATP-binding protein [Prauserella sediminis]MCR3720203.1 ABC-2 type transport system ATP-binding protein [Prauserella flava]MCR3734088.1 ABC-2 type transport system ATP-binding protein [Prauserella salsuginis]
MVSIDVRNAYVDFPIFDAKTRSMKKRVLGKVGGKIGSDSKVPIIEALQDVNLQLSDGDRLALVGHNGAGKSTLLRLLSGIYEPTRGSAKVTGKVAPVFDLGVGMDPETSGFENIIVRGLFLGKSRKEMEKRLDDIAEFTELGDYLAMPLRTYSTGMRVRLALGVVTSIDPEILILDEGLGAVDASFMNKARDRLKDLVKRSGILVFASHSDELLLELCDQAMWMDEGRVRQHGRLREVLTSYKGKDPFQNVSREVLERLGQANPDDVAKPSDGKVDGSDGQAADKSAATAPANGG